MTKSTIKQGYLSSITKIASGYYRGSYRGVDFTINKVNLPSEVAWYWQIGDERVHDWHPSKRISIIAVKEYIDETINP